VKIWLVNPFDPLPGDPEQEGRYGSLVRHLVAAGHEPTWWTSSFSHRFKRPVDKQQIRAACDRIGVQVRFLDAPAYHKNVGARRLWNHCLLARRLGAAARREPRSNHPRVLIASAPPCFQAHAAVELAHRLGAKAIVDVQDLWPETFSRALPRSLRGLSGAALYPWQRKVAKAYRLADAIVGVADGYVERALKLAGVPKPVLTIPLGLDLAVFDSACARGKCTRFTKPDDEVWLIYSGSLNRSYDCLTILAAAGRVRDRLGARAKWRLFVTGRGELQARAGQIVAAKGLENVTLTGFVEFDAWAYLLSQCDAGFNAAFDDALIFLPNKVFYYFAAGLAVANTIRGQCSRIIRDAGCGMDYRPGDVEACAQVMQQLITQPDRTRQMGRSARRLAETVYDRDLLMPQYVEFIEQVAGR